MALATISPFQASTSLLITAPKSLFHSNSKPCDPKLSLPSSTIFPPNYQLRRATIYTSPCLRRILRKRSQLWRVSAVSEDALPSEAAIEKAQQIVPTTDDGSGSIISTLLLIAFVGLSILTIGVIYLAVTDFLQKRERDKFEKEEEAKKKKKGGKKGKVKVRSGPRGFGQKIEEDDD